MSSFLPSWWFRLDAPGWSSLLSGNGLINPFRDKDLRSKPMKFKFCVSQDETMKLGQTEREENATKAFKKKKVQLLGGKVRSPFIRRTPFVCLRNKTQTYLNSVGFLIGCS